MKVLGLGSINNDMIDRNCTYTGENANREYSMLSDCYNETLPMEKSTNDDGEVQCNLDTSCFAHELMSGGIISDSQSLSRISVAMLEDRGYNVDFSQADDFMKENLDQSCTCIDGGRRNLSYLSQTKHLRVRSRTHRRLSSSMYREALEHGMMILDRNFERKLAIQESRIQHNVIDEYPEFVGHQSVSVIVLDKDDIFHVKVNRA